MDNIDEQHWREEMLDRSNDYDEIREAQEAEWLRERIEEEWEDMERYNDE